MLPWHYYVQGDDDDDDKVSPKKQHLGEQELEQKVIKIEERLAKIVGEQELEQKVIKIEGRLAKIERQNSEPEYDIKVFLKKQSFDYAFFNTPSHKKLLSAYRKIVQKVPSDQSDRISAGTDTLIVIGPKGCGKTTSLKKLHQILTDENEKKAAYIDLALVRKEKFENLMKTLKKKRVEVLMLDNVQTITDYIGVERFTYVIGAFSPGAMVSTSMHKFRKVRTDGHSRNVYFRPLKMNDSTEFLRLHGVTDEETVSKCYYYSGGVPRYLHWIAEHGMVLGGQLINEELEAIYNKYPNREGFRESLNNFVLDPRNRDQTDDVVMAGIGYIEDGNAHLISPKYIDMVLRHELLLSSGTNWQQLEQLTLFQLKYKKNVTVVNYCGTKISIPTPTMNFVQQEIGEMPKVPKHDVCLIVLAPKHPVIDAMLLDRQSDLKVFFFQTSFSKYANHRKKRKDLYETELALGMTVDKYYDTKISEFAEPQPRQKYFVYATTEFDKKCKDENVYFMDLRNEMFECVI